MAAPAASFFPVAIAGLIACIILVALVCQVSLCWRYFRLRRVASQLRGDWEEGATLPSVRQTLVNRMLGKSAAIFLGVVDSARRRGSAFDPEAAVDFVAQSENELLRVAFVRWALGSVLIMGLAGTFLAFVQLIVGSGLLPALGTLRNAAQSGVASPNLADAYAQLSTAFANVYQALGYAFVASLSGLAGTIVLGLVGTVGVQRLKGRALLGVARFAEGLLPVVAPALDHGERLANALTTTASALETSGQLIDVLREASGLLHGAAAHFEGAGMATTQLTATLTMLTTEIQSSHQKWDLLVDALRDSKTTMGETLEAFRKEAIGQREQTRDVVASAVGEMREITRTLAGEMRTSTDALAGEIRKVSAAKMDQFVTIQTELRNLLVETKRDWEQAGADVISSTGEAFAASLASVNQVIAHSRTEAAAAHDRIAEVANRTSEVVTSHSAALAKHTEAVAASLQQWGGAPAAYERTLGETNAVLSVLAVAVERLNAMPEQWERQVVGSIRQLEAQLQAGEQRARTSQTSFTRAWIWVQERLRGGGSK